MSESIIDTPTDLGHKTERLINTAPTDIPANDNEEPETLEAELLELDYGDKTAIIKADPRQLELEAPIDDKELESLHANDLGVIGRYTTVDQLDQASVMQNEKLKKDGIALGVEIGTIALLEAKANQEQIIEAVDIIKKRADEAGRLALAEVQRIALAKMANGESIQEVSTRIDEAATDILNLLTVDSHKGRDIKERSVKRRDKAIKTKNAKIKEMTDLYGKVQEQQKKIDAAQAKIHDEYEVSRIEVLNDEGELNKAENEILRPLQPAIMAIMSDYIGADMSGRYSDPKVFKDMMRAVYEELAQTNIGQSGGITPNIVRMAVDNVNDPAIKPDDWFIVQRRRQLIHARGDSVQRDIDREQANISEAKLLVNNHIEAMTRLAEERDTQHELYQYENQVQGSKAELHSTMFKDIAETVNNILHGDASSITEAAIRTKFGYKFDDQLPENSLPAKLVALLQLKRRYQMLIRDPHDVGDNLPIAPIFDGRTDLPALDIDDMAAFEVATDYSERIDALAEKIEPFQGHNPLTMSVKGLDVSIKERRRHIKKTKVTKRFFTKQDESKEA